MVIYTSTTDTAARTALHSLPANYANDITINHVAVMNSFNGESDRIKIQRRFRFCFDRESKKMMSPTMKQRRLSTNTIVIYLSCGVLTIVFVMKLMSTLRVNHNGQRSSEKINEEIPISFSIVTVKTDVGMEQRRLTDDCNQSDYDSCFMWSRHE